ncbi:MAG: TolC family protein [Phycisphaerales bacterium]|nr:TolC family protein [Phycisphaerales bacterium]
MSEPSSHRRRPAGAGVPAAAASLPRVTLALLLASATALLGACMGSPFRNSAGDYHPPTSMERLRTIRNLDLSDAAVGEPPPPEEDLADQIERFRAEPNPFEGRETYELTLEQCRAWVLENNLDIHVALVNPVIANQSLSIEEAAWESVFFVNARHSESDQPTDSQLSGSQTEFDQLTPGLRVPLRTGGQINLSTPFTRAETDNIFSTLNPSYTADFNLTISQPLLRGGWRRANTYALRIEAINNDLTNAATKLEVIRQLSQADRAYWGLFAIQRVLDVRIRQYQLATEQLDRAERRVRLQEAAQIEVTRAQAAAAERLEGIIQARNAFLQAQRELKRVMNTDGLGVRSDVLLNLVTDPQPVEYALNPDTLADDALAGRMEMLQLELQLAQDLSTIDFLKNQALPLFSMDYSYNVNGLGDSFSNAVSVTRRHRFEDWSLGVNFEVPIGNEAAEARVHRAILQRLQRLSTRQAQVQAIEQEVFNAVDGINSAWQRILAARINVLLAQRTYDAEVNQFNQGLRTSTDVSDAAARLSEAESTAIRALADYEIAQVDLAFATGTTLGATRTRWTPWDPRTPADNFGERPENSRPLTYPALRED